MPNYRLYHIKDNHFIGCDEFDAEDDQQARRHAAPLNGTAASELWEGGRKITTFQP